MTEQVRLARESDAAAIARIWNEGIADRVATFETEPRTVDAILTGIRERGNRYPTVVVERHGEIVSVYVARAARGRGAGRRALAALLTVCQERGFWKLVSRIFPENVASLALCRSGFARSASTATMPSSTVSGAMSSSSSGCSVPQDKTFSVSTA